MKIFVAGASGAIGVPLVAALVQQGHTVTGMTRSDAGAKRLAALGAAVARLSAFDAEGLAAAMHGFSPEIVIDQLTALPRHPAAMAAAAEGDRKLRLEGGGNLLRAAQAAGVRRYIQQSSGFFLREGDGLGDENELMAVDATPRIAASAQTFTELERRLFAAPEIEGVALRYGFFYGPNTWYYPDGGAADQVRKRQFPIVGQGAAVWSWIHVEDAAAATIAAMTAPAGTYNVVDDEPSPVHVWLPAFAKAVDAPPPRRIGKVVAMLLAGRDAVYYENRLRGASNQKARQLLQFRPRRLEWYTT